MQAQMELLGGGGEAVVVGVKAKIRELTMLNNIFSGCKSKEGVAFYLDVCFTVPSLILTNQKYKYIIKTNHTHTLQLLLIETTSPKKFPVRADILSLHSKSSGKYNTTTGISRKFRKLGKRLMEGQFYRYYLLIKDL